MAETQTNNNKTGIIRTQRDAIPLTDTTLDLASNQDQILYDQNGLDYAANLPFINKRDNGGNLVINGSVQEVPLQESEQYNESLIFELTDRAYTNRSVNRAIDTQFKYFKFPPTIITTQVPVPDINIEIPVQNENDLFSSLYVVNSSETEFYEFAPSLTNNSGNITNPWKTLLFNQSLNGIQQTYTNKYTISPALIDSGKDLLLSFKIAVVNGNPTDQYVYFVRLNRQSIDFDDNRSSVLVDQFGNRLTNASKVIFPGRWDILEKTIRVKNQDMRPYDNWFVEGHAGQKTRASTFTSNPNYYYAPQSYFEIQAVDPIQGN